MKVFAFNSCTSNFSVHHSFSRFISHIWFSPCQRCYRSFTEALLITLSVCQVRLTLRCNLLEHRGQLGVLRVSSSEHLLAQKWQKRARKGAVDVRNSGCSAVMRPLVAQCCGGRKHKAKGGDLASGLSECHSSALLRLLRSQLDWPFVSRMLKTCDQWEC